MAGKRLAPEQHLQKLQAAALDLHGQELVDVLESAMDSKSCIVVERAAKMVVELESRVSEDCLRSAYDRFLIDPTEIDRGCRAKLPLVEALVYREHDDPDFYKDGMKYVQPDPVWGQVTDSAGNLRGACAFGLVHSRIASPAETMNSLIELLADADRLARMHAARAITMTGSQCVVPVLRLKASIGDDACEVLGECFRGLLSHSPNNNADFVAGFLFQREDTAIEAATAIGESRNERGVARLLKACVNCRDGVREAFYVSAALSRAPAAIEFLLQLVRNDSEYAAIALKSLSPVRFYSGIADQVEAAVIPTGNRELESLFTKTFESG